ncbi:MAG: hypothetical protein KJ899_15455, partial [Gammaproteobacteria bacterium]|nr:hypothetical protein [Gammaproteobacteria bacterium]
IEILKRGAGIEVNTTTERIRTLEDQIRICQIDTDKFISPWHQMNSWEVPLKFLDPKPTIVFTPVHQVKSSWEPKSPEAIHPVVHPVTAEVKAVSGPKVKRTRGRILVLPDVQIGFRKNQQTGRLTPYHDRRALDIALQAALLGGFTDVVWLGDLLDLNEWSDKFLKEPSFYFTTQPAIYEAHWWVAQFCKALPKAHHRKLEGNHEFRMPKQIISHLLAAFELQSAKSEIKWPVLSIETLLGLDSLGVEYVSGYPNNETFVGPVRFIHGAVARAGAGDTTKKVVQDTMETVVQGHKHTIEMAGSTIRERGRQRPVFAFSPGCLCRIDYVVPGHDKGQHWQQGFATVDYEGDLFGIAPVVIDNGRAVYDGKVLAAREPLKELDQFMKDKLEG